MRQVPALVVPPVPARRAATRKAALMALHHPRMAARCCEPAALLMVRPPANPGTLARC